jgi:hypothetical protein
VGQVHHQPRQITAQAAVVAQGQLAVQALHLSAVMVESV